MPPFEPTPFSVDTLTQLHALHAQRQQLEELLRADATSRLIDFQHDSAYKASMLAALSMLPSSLASSLPTPQPLSRAQPTFTPSASLSFSLSALTALAQHLSLHSVDEAVMLAALTQHKAAQQQQQFEQQQLSHHVRRLQHHVRSTQHDTAAHRTLLGQLQQHSVTTLQPDTQQHAAELHTYTTKHGEYKRRLAAAQTKLKQSHAPTLSQLLAVRDEVELLETRLTRVQAEVGAWGGLSSDVRVARRQVAEAEAEMVRLEDEIERRLCAMSAFE